MADQPDQLSQILAALDAADKAHDAALAGGDQAKADGIAAEAKQLAAMAQTATFTPAKVIPPPADGNNTNGGAPAQSVPATLAHHYLNAVAAPLETGASVATGAIAQPLAGLAALTRYTGADANPSIGEDTDPADTVNDIQQNLTYSPRTPGGQATSQALGAVAGLIPKGANAAGQATSEATGSPLAGALVNAGLQGAGMWATGKAPGVAGAALKSKYAQGPLNLVSDYLPGGANRAASRVATQFAGGPDAASAAVSNVKAHQAAQAALDQAGASGSLAGRYGIQPTTAQIAQNPGLAQMSRTLRNQPDLTTAFTERDAGNGAAINGILEGISGSPVDRLRASTARDFKARTAYDDALNNPDHFVQPPAPDAPTFAAEQAAKSGLTKDGTAPVNDPNAPATGLNDIGVRLQDLLQRPAMSDAMNNASRIAANFGKKLDQRNLIQQMHYAKMHLDDQIGAARAAGKTNDLNSLMDTKHALLGVMDDLSPAYAQARTSFQSDSRPLNRMEVGEALRQKYNSALADAGGTGTRPSQFAEALRKDNGDAIARQATGFGGATMEESLYPGDIDNLNVARDQLARQQYEQSAGRGVGSNTGQNLANQRTLDNVGSVNQLSEDMGPAMRYAATLAHPGIAVASAVRGGMSRAATRARLAQMALDPDEFISGMKQNPNRPGAAGSLPEKYALPGAVGANENSDEEPHMADGGSFDPESVPMRKSTFWELVQQAVKELTPSSGSPPPPQPAPQPAQPQAGYSPSGTVGHDFDSRVDAGVAANE